MRRPGPAHRLPRADRRAERRQLRGQEGPAGDPGPQGLTGAKGEDGTDATVDGVAAGGDLTGTYPNPSLAANPTARAFLDLDDQTIPRALRLPSST